MFTIYIKGVSKMKIGKSASEMVVENLKEIKALIESGKFTVNNEDTEDLYKVSLDNAILRIYKTLGQL